VPTKALAGKSAAKKPQPKKDGLTEAQIAVHWKEEGDIRPPARFIAQANLNDPQMVERFSEKNFPECFREYAELLH
jgi:acetyl-CoA synthetase